MERRYRYEISVGLFVIAAAVILGYISLKISRMRVRDGIEVDFLFSHACSLVKDSPVAVAGVEVGYVKGLRLDAGKARVTARIGASAGMRKNVKATIRQKSLLGEPYLELLPSVEEAPLLADGDLVADTVTPVQIDQTFSRLGSILQEIEPSEAARFLTALMQDPEATRRIIKNADALLEKLAALKADELREFIQQMKIRARLF
jgi:ABC-type transporter Mla subunit MlaD